MQTIVLAEDDLNLGMIVNDQLKHAGFQVEWVRNGEEALKSILKKEPNIAVVDLMMPVMDGQTLIKELRQQKCGIPILVLTALDDIGNKKESFAAGADDYLCKPFDIEELVLRIQALLRRTLEGSASETVEDEIVLSDETTYKHSVRTLTFQHSEPVVITEKESEILYFLIQNKGQIRERNSILKAVWGSDDYFNGRTLDVYLSRLRKYLQADEGITIKNIHGKGYLLEIN
jgi:two-component system OmpR family response regulator